MTDIDALIEYAKEKALEFEIEFERDNPIRDRDWLARKITESLVCTLASLIYHPLDADFGAKAMKKYYTDTQFYGLVQQQLVHIMFLVDAYRRFECQDT